MVEKNKDYVRAKMRYTVGKKLRLRLMQRLKGKAMDKWRESWREMLNYIEKF
jgi:hypothetical protein